MPPPSNEKSVTPEVRRYQQVYCNQRHDTLGYKLLDYERNEMPELHPNFNDDTNIENHEGKKYLRNIYDAVTNEVIGRVDVYEVLEAFNVTSQPIGHAIKKLLACGQRGKGDAIADLEGAIAAIKRAINIQLRSVE